MLKFTKILKNNCIGTNTIPGGRQYLEQLKVPQLIIEN